MKKTKHEDNPASIKYYVKNYILKNREMFAGKKVLDVPAGSGVTTRILREVGAKVYPFDLFPDFFHESDETCRFCDLTENIPVKDGFFDVVICQEGIEHLPNLYLALAEMNRVLKKDGLLIITTPNYSNIQSRLSYLFFESENSGRFMPPNEYDSIWFSGEKKTSGGASRSKAGKKPEAKYYFGHVFLIGIQKFRLLWKINGFELVELVKNKVKPRNLVLLAFWFPVIALQSLRLLQKNLKVWRRRSPGNRSPDFSSVFKEQLKLNLSSTVLLHSHLFVVCRKSLSTSEAYHTYKTENTRLYTET